MGPLLLARLLDLNETQTGVLNIVFKVADDNGLLLLDLKDLRAAMGFVAENASKFTVQYGTVSTASVGAIQRGLLALEQEGADQFFGEPALELGDLLQCAEDGRGIINILAADVLMNKPKIYSTFLLWLLSELFEQLPERGDADKPRLVFFFDEAHLLFKDAPKALTEKIEQVVRLIRSKGVGVYFVSQSPLDIPDAVRGQLGNRVQHALRAFSAAEQKQLKAVAESFRVAKGFDAAEAIMDLGVGEALVSLLDAEGQPAVVERAKIAPPQSFIGPLDDKARAGIIAASPFVAKYTETIDRESAFEKLQQRVETAPAAKAGTAQPKAAARQPKEQDSDLEKMVKSIAVGAGRSVARSAGQQIVRGILGSLFR
jgi:DNA helicase HerA-like ATPase